MIHKLFTGNIIGARNNLSMQWRNTILRGGEESLGRGHYSDSNKAYNLRSSWCRPVHILWCHNGCTRCWYHACSSTNIDGTYICRRYKRVNCLKNCLPGGFGLGGRFAPSQNSIPAPLHICTFYIKCIAYFVCWCSCNKNT